MRLYIDDEYILEVRSNGEEVALVAINSLSITEEGRGFVQLFT
jgi:hypothetical protein